MNLSYNKKIIKIAVLSTVLAIGVSLIFCGINLKNKSDLTQAKENVENYVVPKDYFDTNKEEKITQNKETKDFIIKEYNGSVAVFENGQDLPFKTTETMVADLPTADRELLKKGIGVGSPEELSRILEDYCS